MLASVKLCAGAGGQALCLENTGLEHTALVKIDKHRCKPLRHNRPNWNVLGEDMRLSKRRAANYRSLDLIAGGLPCPPFSAEGKQLGESDERSHFNDAIDFIDDARPRAVKIENVRCFLSDVPRNYRESLKFHLNRLGYKTDWRLLNASDYGVSQLRPRIEINVIQKEHVAFFDWPEPNPHNPPPLSMTLSDLCAADGWKGAKDWAVQADEIPPPIVGESKKHSGPDFGPTRAPAAWATLGVEARTIAPEARRYVHEGMPHLTVSMVARIQGFPVDWHFTGAKTNAYMQVGDAFRPPIFQVVFSELAKALHKLKCPSRSRTLRLFLDQLSLKSCFGPLA